MKLQAKKDESGIIYSLSTWAWDDKRHALIQCVPITKEIRFSVPRGGIEPLFDQPLPVTEKHYVPTLRMGQLVKLDRRDMYVARIEIADSPEQVSFVYLMSEVEPTEIIWWTVEVAEEKK